MKNLSIISFTEKGIQLSEKIAEHKGWRTISESAALFSKCSRMKTSGSGTYVQFVEESTGEWAKEQMEEGNALLFIGACGIAVRTIAPYIIDKLYDSPVLVMDEKGQYIIPILSGHMGGANEIAAEIAEKTGAAPVITTATDINGRFAVDLFAKRNALHIVNKEGIAKISAKVLAGEEITMTVETGHIVEGAACPEGVRMIPYPPKEPVDIVISGEETPRKACEAWEALLYLKPGEYVIGMGCKKGKEPEKIEAFLYKSMEEAGITKNQLFALASIDRKKEEEGFLRWSRKERIPFLTFSAERLQKTQGNFHGSAFVEERTGVDNVCERAALEACGPGGKLIYEKHAEDGMTVAIAKREWRVSFVEE
ncbi:MAG: cobalt-precorrin 5A hydrolase [Lachnoclostridium sp.]|nr:cobalt-precorrin 5A hydrolase [Lachnospira sp.]MCM1247164.1 cobalt-precorrin 5A hydrolase [Lachnoclostridium sp.]